MGEMRVDRDTNHLNTTLGELFHTVVKCQQLRWADKGEVEWVEEDYRVLTSLGLVQVVIGLNLAIAQYGWGCKIGCFASY